MRDFRMGGGEKLTLSMLNRIDKTRFEALIVVLDESGPLRASIPSDIVVKTLQGKQGNAFQFPFRVLRYSALFAKIIDFEKPHTVVTDNWFAGILGCSVAGVIHKNGGKLIVEFHLPVNVFVKASTFKNIFATFKKLITSYLFRKADRVVAISKLMAKEIGSHLGIAADRIELIYNGIDIRRIEDASREVTFAYTQSPYIISIGRLEPEKGHTDLIRAYANIASKIPHSLVIVGEGSLREYLSDLAQCLSLKDRVIFTGNLENPFGMLKHAGFLVLPSRWEAFPTVLLEALALKVPVIATASDGPVEILDNGQYGLLVPPGDITALSAAILEVASQPGKRDHYRSKSRLRAERYSLDRMVGEYEKLFSTLSESQVQ